MNYEIFMKSSIIITYYNSFNCLMISFSKSLKECHTYVNGYLNNIVVSNEQEVIQRDQNPNPNPNINQDLNPNLNQDPNPNPNLYPYLYPHPNIYTYPYHYPYPNIYMYPYPYLHPIMNPFIKPVMNPHVNVNMQPAMNPNLHVFRNPFTNFIHNQKDSVKEDHVKEDHVKEDHVKEDLVKEDLVKEDLAKEDLVKEDLVKEDSVEDVKSVKSVKKVKSVKDIKFNKRKSKTKVDLREVEPVYYSEKILLRLSNYMIFPGKDVGIYNPQDKRFYKTSKIMPSICAYKGSNKMLEQIQKMAEEYNEELYVIAPVYSAHRIYKKIDQTDKNVFKIFNGNVCNMRDAQATFGGKAKVEEPFNFAATREVLEESGIFFDPSNLTLFCSLEESNIVTNCYFSRITSGIGSYNNDSYINYINHNDHTKNMLADDFHRKVCVSIYGTFDEISDFLVKSDIKDMEDNIIALMVIPIETAIVIDLNGQEYSEKMKRRKSYRKFPKLF